MDLPDADQREQILRVLLQKESLEADIDYKEVCRETCPVLVSPLIVADRLISSPSSGLHGPTRLLPRHPSFVPVSAPSGTGQICCVSSHGQLCLCILYTKPLVCAILSTQLAKLLEGYSGSDLRNLCVAAAYQPIREIIAQENMVEKLQNEGLSGVRAAVAGCLGSTVDSPRADGLKYVLLGLLYACRRGCGLVHERNEMSF